MVSQDADGLYRTDALAEPVRRGQKYVLRPAPWEERGLSLWVDGQDGRSQLVMDDLPASALHDFETYCDQADEEMRILLEQARQEFGWSSEAPGG